MTDTRNRDLTFGADDWLAFVAPYGTPAPTDMTPVVAPWLCVGWASKSGGEQTPNEERKDLEAAGSTSPIASKITKSDRSMKFTGEEAISPLLRSFVDNVPMSELAPGAGGIAAYDLPDRPSRRSFAWLFIAVQADDKAIWTYYSCGEITGRGSDNAPTDDYTVNELTVTAYRAPDGRPAVSKLIDYGGADLSAFFSDEIQQVAITGTPTGGNFTLTYSAQTTANIAYNATAANVKTALEALSNIATGDITATGGPLPGTPVVVEFGGTVGSANVTQMTGSAAGLTGGTTPAVVVTTTADGAVSALD